MLILLLCLINQPKAQTCWDFDCETLDYGVWARYKSKTLLQINSDSACSRNQICYYDNIISWAENFVRVDGDQYLWEDIVADDRQIYEDTVYCGTRPNGDSLAEGSHPKRWNTYLDCRRADGNTSECKCGFDGSTWCVAEWGSSWYDEFWELWGDDGQVAEGTYNTWTNKYARYLLTASGPSCIDQFYEIQQLNPDEYEVRESSAFNIFLVILTLLTQMVQQSKTRSDITTGFILGGAMWISQSPVVNYFNNVSVVATRYNLSWFAPYSKVYSGVDGAPPNSYLNCFRGIQAHLAKEIPRLIFKPAGIYVLLPRLQETYSPLVTSLVFAGSLSLAEMVIANPPDAIRVQRQAGHLRDYSLKALYRGSLGNGVKQFTTWMIFAFGMSNLNLYLPRIGVDPHSGTGCSIKVLYCGTVISCMFPIERLKNEVQHQYSLCKTGGYFGAAKGIFHTGGFKHLYCGVGAKFISNTAVAVAAVALAEMGRRNLLENLLVKINVRQDQIKNMAAQKNTQRDIIHGFLYGGAFWLAQSPFVNYLNNVSVVATRYNISWMAPYRKVYSGVDGAPPNSYLNSFRGIQAHLVKEFPRLLFKPAGIYVLLPRLQQRFSNTMTSVVFAGALSVAEMAIANPPDALRVQRQAGHARDYSLKALYRGALGNGLRQFVTWFLFSITLGKLNAYLPQAGVDPHSWGGIFSKAFGCSAAISCFFPIERLKNEVQHQYSFGNKSGYLSAAKNIYNNGGLRNLYCGTGAKFLSNATLATAAVLLAEMGSKTLNK